MADLAKITASGHKAKLMPPRYVKPYGKRNKNDAPDAEGICEAGNQAFCEVFFLSGVAVAGE